MNEMNINEFLKGFSKSKDFDRRFQTDVRTEGVNLTTASVE